MQVWILYLLLGLGQLTFALTGSASVLRGTHEDEFTLYLRERVQTKSKDDQSQFNLPESSPALISKRRDLSAIEEIDKERCCRRAFDLCEPTPKKIGKKKYQRLQRRYLQRAQKSCSKILGNPKKPQKLKRSKICGFYNGHLANCAMTPQNSQDFERYIDQLEKCCDVSPKICDNANNTGLLYNSKRECLWFAARTPESICELSKSTECTSE